jgi:PiT family inorganic phosphate transporter
MLLLLLSSGLFLGWSLGANDAANVFGTAVATRMVRFRTAATVCAIFVILGAVLSGSGTTSTLGDLGAVNALGGSFMVALAAALAVLWMTRAGLPVSVSTAVVGGIIGWNLFTGSRTDVGTLVKIITAWVAGPLLAAGFSAVAYVLVRRILGSTGIHLLRLDAATRLGLIIAGAIGSFALGANNIANVVGVFVPALPSSSVMLFGRLEFTNAQQLFLVGGIAIAVGVYSYSHRVMMTVGRGLFKLTPVTALIVVLAQALILFLFASEGLETWLISHGLPPLPLVPVSSSQAVVGAVIGIALVRKRGRGMRLPVLAKILGGWLVTPVIAALIAFLGLFFLQNVFHLRVYRPTTFELSAAVAERLEGEGITTIDLAGFAGTAHENARALEERLAAEGRFTRTDRDAILRFSEVDRFEIDLENLWRLNLDLLSPGQIEAVRALEGREFTHRWQLREALAAASGEWAPLPDTRANHLYTKELETKLRYVYDAFRVEETDQGR